jgi:rare lipoprotein A
MWAALLQPVDDPAKGIHLSHCFAYGSLNFPAARQMKTPRAAVCFAREARVCALPAATDGDEFMSKLLAAFGAAFLACTLTTSSIGTGEPVRATTKVAAVPPVETVVVVGSLRSHGEALLRSIIGEASWYGRQFHGRLTANGERFNMNAMTAAHRSLPFGTLLRVTNGLNGMQTIVRINDRGPYVGNREIDLSRAAAKALHLVDTGVAPVLLEVIGQA